MTKEKYNELMKQLQVEFEQKKKKLYRDYVIANDPYKVGDIVTDHIVTIKIEKVARIGFPMSSKFPCAIYEGIELKKNLEPKKSGAIRQVWQVNLIKK